MKFTVYLVFLQHLGKYAFVVVVLLSQCMGCFSRPAQQTPGTPTMNENRSTGPMVSCV